MGDAGLLRRGVGQVARVPRVGREELVRFFTLTSADESFVRSHRGPVNRLGGVQLCTLPWLGFVPDDVGSAPGRGGGAGDRVSAHPGGNPWFLWGREQTRAGHLVEIAKFLGWRQAGEAEFKELGIAVEPEWAGGTGREGTTSSSASGSVDRTWRKCTSGRR